MHGPCMLFLTLLPPINIPPHTPLHLQEYQKLFELDPEDFGPMLQCEKEANAKHQVRGVGWGGRLTKSGLSGE